MLTVVYQQRVPFGNVVTAAAGHDKHETRTVIGPTDEMQKFTYNRREGRIYTIA